MKPGVCVETMTIPQEEVLGIIAKRNLGCDGKPGSDDCTDYLNSHDPKIASEMGAMLLSDISNITAALLEICREKCPLYRNCKNRLIEERKQAMVEEINKMPTG